MTFGYTTGTGTSNGTTFTGQVFFRVRFSVPPPPPVLRPKVCAHSLFGLSCETPFSDVRRAYRRLAKIAHPDLAPPERKAELGQWMRLLNTAFEALEKGAVA